MLSDRVKNMKPSIFSKYTDLIKKREQEGISFYKLNMGQPDFDTDSTYFESLSKYNVRTNKYGNPSGSRDLKVSVSRYYTRLNSNISLNADDVIITQGASDAIIKLLYSICDSDDEIIILEPFFADYKMYCDMLNIKIRAVSWNCLNSESLERVVNAKTKAILFANPNNPDGSIITEPITMQIIDVSKKYNLFIISDEVYSGLVYDKGYMSFVNFLDNNVVVVDSASKKLNLCGSRIGYIICKNSELCNKLTMINDCRISISNVEQFAVASMLEKVDKIIRNSRRIYQSRINIIQKKLNKTKIRCIHPYGGITMLLELPFEANKYVEWLIKKYEKDGFSLLVTPANDFYISNNGINKIRICVTIDDKEIEKVIDLLLESVTKYMEELL